MFTSSSPFIFCCANASVYVLRIMRYLLVTFFLAVEHADTLRIKKSRTFFYINEKHSMGNIITNSSLSYTTVTLTVSISSINHKTCTYSYYIFIALIVCLEVWNACSHFWLRTKQICSILKLTMLLKVCNICFIQRFMTAPLKDRTP